jgi:hypothetical protein
MTTNKRYSYLRVTTIRIDVHPGGETKLDEVLIESLRGELSPAISA